jgi:hypothetical protein
MKIFNLTQHPASKEQKEAGVVELSGWHEGAKSVLNFNMATPRKEKVARAKAVVGLVKAAGAKAVMIGGKASFVAILSEELAKAGILPLEAFTRRDVEEVEQGDGSVKKVAVFRHEGWDVFLPSWWANTSQIDFQAYHRLKETAKALGLEDYLQ